MASSPGTTRALQRARVDFPPSPRPPLASSVVAATIVAVAASLAADAALVAIGEAIMPSTRGFSHFRFSDYASLTVIGVVAACCTWPVVTRVSSAPRWLLARMAVVVTVVLWIPDLWILVGGEPAGAVAVLMVMHLAIALVTFYVLVGVAPAAPPLVPGAQGAPAVSHPGQGRGTTTPFPEPSPTTDQPQQPGTTASSPAASDTAAMPLAASDTAAVPRRWHGLVSGRAIWAAMLALLGVELVLGVVAIVAVPVDRPSGWLPHQGAPIYLGHALIGAVLGLGAVLLVTGTRHLGSRISRDVRLAAAMGVVGIGVAGIGGMLCADHGAARLIGMGLMLAGTMVAALGYVLPLIGPPSAPPIPGAAQPDPPDLRPAP